MDARWSSEASGKKKPLVCIADDNALVPSSSCGLLLVYRDRMTSFLAMIFKARVAEAGGRGAGTRVHPVEPVVDSGLYFLLQVHGCVVYSFFRYRGLCSFYK